MTFRVTIEELRFGPNPPAGMNAVLLLHFAYVMRAGTEDLDPIEVTRDPGGGVRVHDGRHRAIAAMIGGRPDVLAKWA